MSIPTESIDCIFCLGGVKEFCVVLRSGLDSVLNTSSESLDLPNQVAITVIRISP